MAARYVRIGQHPDYRDEIRGTLSEILASTANPGTYAAPEDVTGTYLEMGADGLWTGNLGTLTQAQADTLVASGVMGNVKAGISALVDATQMTWRGIGAGWVAVNLIDPSASGDIAIFGNSIIEQNGGRFVQGLTDYYNSVGFVQVACTRSNGRARIVENWGIGGQNSSDLLARVSQVVNSQCGTVVVMEVTNDSSRGIAASVLFENYKAIASAIIASGKNCVMCTGIPKETMTAGALQFYSEMNALILGYSAPGYFACDVATPLRDVGGTALAGTLRDGIHPNAYGAFLMSGPLVTTINSIVPARNIAIRPQALAANQLANPLFSGSGTSAPASWNMQAAPTSWSYVTRDDGLNQTCAKARCNDGTGMIITQNIDVATMPLRTRIRAYVRMKAENVEAAPAARTQDIRVYAQFYNGSTFIGLCDAGYWDNTPNSFENQPLSGNLLFRTNAIRIPAGTTLTQLVIQCGRGGDYTLYHAVLCEDTE